MNKPQQDPHDSAREQQNEKREGGDLVDPTMQDTAASQFPDTETATPSVGSDIDQGIPKQIGNYRVQRVLGQGGMGRVYLCEQANPKRLVAVKVMTSRLSPGALRRFQLEAETLAHLQHPGIAQIFEAGTFTLDGSEQPFIAMELVEGKPLSSKLQKDLTLAAKIELLIETMQAMEHAHQNGVIHRDLKPGNILVNESLNPKVLDFGLARREESDGPDAEQQTEAGQILGTLAYMSPEQASGNPSEIDTRSDVYALGVIAYELFSGELPIAINRNSLTDSLVAIREKTPSPLGKLAKDCRGDLEIIVGKALEKEKIRRYQSVAELRSDFERHLQKVPIVARPASTWYRFSRFTQRNRAWVGFAAAALTAIVVSLVVVSGLLINTNQINDKLAIRNRELDESRSEAETARDDALDRLGETYVLSARIASRRGQWKEALEFYDKRLAMSGGSEQIQLDRLKMLSTSDNIRATKKLITELESSVGESGLAQLQLMKGELMLCEFGDTGDAEDAKDLISKAIHSGRLDAQEVEYARGLMAESVPDAIKYFRNALSIDPFHHQARIQLAMMLLLHGYFDEARAQTALAGLIFPDDHMVDVIEMLMLLAENNLDDAIAISGRLESVLGERKTQAIIRVMEVVNRFAGESREMESASGLEIAVFQFEAMSEFTQLIVDTWAMLGLDANGAETPLRNHPIIGAAFDTFRSMLLAAPFGRNQKMVEISQDIQKVFPTAESYSLEATYHGALADKAEERGDLEEARNQLELAVGLYERALTSPAFLQNDRIWDEFALIMQRMSLLRLTPSESDEQEDMANEVRDRVSRFAKRTDLNPLMLNICTGYAIVLGDIDTARFVSRRWIEKAPEDHWGHLYQARAEASAGNFFGAVESMNRLLELPYSVEDNFPTYENLAQTRDQYVENHLKQALDLHLQTIGTEYPVSFSINSNLANILMESGQTDDAITQLEVALQIARQNLGEDHSETFETQNLLGVLYWREKRLDRSIPVFESLLGNLEASLGPEHPDTIRAHANLGINYRDAERFDEGIHHLEIATRISGFDLDWAVTALLDAYRQRGMVDEAVALKTELLRKSRNEFGAIHATTLATQYELAKLQQEMGRPIDSVQTMREVLDGRRQLYGDNHTTTIDAKNHLGVSLLEAGEYEESEALFLQSIDSISALEHAPADWLSVYYERIVRLYVEWEKPDEAIHWKQEQVSYEKTRSDRGENHRDTIVTQYELANLQRTMGRVADSAQTLREVLEGRRELLGEDHITTIDTKNHLGVVLMQAGEHGEAEEQFLQSIKELRSVGNAPPHWLSVYYQRLADLYVEWDKPGDAARWKSEKIRYDVGRQISSALGFAT